MKKNNFKKIIWFLFYVLIFIFLLYNSFGYLDADLGWHLKVGEQIKIEKTVPRLDHYDYTLEGKTWVDHEWLMNFISFWLFEHFGYLGLTAFFAFIVWLTLIVLTLFTKKYFLNSKISENKQNGLIMFFQLLGVMAMGPHLGVRIQEISLLFILILLIVLREYSQKKNHKLLFLLPLLFYIWSLAHAGFLIGLFLLFFFLGINLVENLVLKIKVFKSFSFDSSLSYKELLVFLGFTCVSILATFLTPYGLGLYSFLSEYSNTFYMKQIAEWLPVYCLPILYKQLFYSAIVVSLLLLFTFNIYKKIKQKTEIKIDLWQLALTVLFLILSFKSKRHFPLFFIISFPWLIKLACEHLTYPKDFFNFLKNSKIIKSYLIVGFLLIIVSFIIKTNFTNHPFSFPKYCHTFPCQTVDFLKSSPEYYDYKIFNSYDWGGYFIWAYPEKKLFIDGRLPQYKYKEHTLLEEYLDFFDIEKTSDKLDEYDINMVLWRKQPSLKLNWFEKHILLVNEERVKNDKSDFHAYLQDNQNWDKIYEDPISELYIRKQ